MSALTVRVDDRLVHGQVVVGWGQALNLRRLVLVDDEIRASSWEQDLYRMGVPPGMELEFASVAEAGAAFPRWVAEGGRTMVILGNVDTLVRLCAAAPVRHVNLGGVHAGEGRRQRLSYVFLTDGELGQLRALAAGGVEVSAQDVPTARPVPLTELAA
jgi:PTS system mannose-specific IIB component/fructoselysine and glucoselysine-specific PTS system IIB component